jgi:hypothetical protein
MKMIKRKSERTTAVTRDLGFGLEFKLGFVFVKFWQIGILMLI